jgi:hypothetical protein
MRPPLTVAQVLAWARAHRRLTGRWPTQHSGEVFGAPGETWKRLDTALRQGSRGLPGGTSLALLLADEAGVRNRASAPPLTAEGILGWADAHFHRTGRWPGAHSGPVAGAPGGVEFPQPGAHGRPAGTARGRLGA